VTVVTVSRLTRRFGALTVLNDVSLSGEEGEVLVVVGPSGSGKSTLLRCIKGLELPSSGTVTVGTVLLDPAMNKADLRAAVRGLRAQSGMVFQGFNLYPHRTVLENVIESPLVVRRMERGEAIAMAERLLDKVGLLDKRDEYPSRLSGGQQQRAAIARSLAMEPRTMLFDEPTSALDPELVREVLAVVRQLARDGVTMIVVTHEMEFARDVGNRVVFMDNGAILEEGDPEAFFSRPTTARAQKFLSQLSHDPE
jgi:L-cystine transport system ATP-binding protein